MIQFIGEDPALLYLASYVCTDRIIVDLKWSIDGKKEIHAPIILYFSIN